MVMLPTEKSMERIGKLVESYTSKTGTTTHPNQEVTEGVVLGLASHLDKHKRPLCPCRFYPDKAEELKHRTWVCPCDDMQIYKYCHCLLFVRKDGLPITEHLPPDHEGRSIWGEVADPAPEQGRPLRHKAAEREDERKERPS
jgi:ferredoxin-thioredoxin reductase catalytic chain